MKNLIINSHHTSIEALEIGGSFVLRWTSLCKAISKDHNAYRLSVKISNRGYVIKKLFRFINSDGGLSKIEYCIGLRHAISLVGSLTDESRLYQKLLDLKSGKFDSERVYSGPCKSPRRSLSDLIFILNMVEIED